MKLHSLIAATVFGLSLLFTATPSFATEDEPNWSCGTPGAENCAPVGGAVCTANGCYQMYCNQSGCTLLFTPHDPFAPGNKER